VFESQPQCKHNTPDITPIQNITIVPFYIDDSFSFHIQNIRVIDLNNYVYESNFKTEITFQSTGAANMWGLDAYSSTDISAVQDIFTVSLEAVSDLQDPTAIYVYLQILF
jgi:hypothetical protein